MLLRIATYCLTAWLIIGNTSVCLAINRSWDDAGNSASKLWSDNGNWSPDGSPSNDDIFIGNLANAANDVTLVDQAFSIQSLTITNGAHVVNSTDNGATNDFELIVNGPTTVSGAGSRILIYGGDPDGLDTDQLTINNGGTVELNSTTAQGIAVVEVDGNSGIGLLDINSGGTLIGTGRIELLESPASATNLLINDGTITANTPALLFQTPAAGTLQIQAQGANAANARFDWDGTAPITAVINVNGNQTLDVDVSTGTDAWSGTMNLYTGSTLDMADAWSMDSGTINANTAAFGFIIIGQDPNPGPAAHIAGANWTMSGGTITVGDSWDSLQLDSQLVASGGTIQNSGTMIFNGGATILSGVDFNMNGDGASLVINSTVNIDTPDFNLDGTATPTNVTTINAGGNLNLDLGAGADEDFNHTVNINGGELDVTTADNDWLLASNGTINAAGGATSTINGETFNIDGRINVTANSTLRINTVSNYSSFAVVVIDAGSALDHSTVTYNGGSFTGGGVFHKGTATIASDTTWNVATVDIDDGSTTINNGATLTVNTDSIDDSGDGIDGTITVSDTGVLHFNLSGGSSVVFDFAGRLIYNGNLSPNTFLSGSDITMNGTMTINRVGRSTARLDIGGTVDITGGAVGTFLLAGGTIANPNTLSGGTINGPGVISADPDRALRGNGTINADVDFNGNSELIASDGLLTVAGNILDIGTLRASGGAAVLDLVQTIDSNVTSNGIAVSGGARIQGAAITLSTHNLRGNGLVTNRVNNNNAIIATSGTLTLNNSTNDWDGTTNTGMLRAQAGDLELRDNATFLFNGTVQADDGREVFANGFELEFDPASNLILSGGTYRSTHATDLGGTVIVNAGNPSRLDVAGTTVFEAGSMTTLNGDLHLDNPTTRIQSGANFSGGGSLVNLGGNTLRLLDGADVDVLLQNQGALALGTGTTAAQTSGTDFQQDATGDLLIELGGTGLNEFDRISLTGIAQLSGELSVGLIGGFNPALNDVFTILTAPGSVLGTFSLEDFSAASLGPGLAWDVLYNPTNVQLTVVDLPSFTADFDNDGDVDGDDFDQWQGDYGLNGMSDADGDGDSDGDDFLTWQIQFGSGVPAALNGAGVPEPSTLLLASLAACFGLLVLRKKKA